MSTITIKTATLLTLFKAHVVTASTGSTREHLNGVCVSWEGIDFTLVSTDGHRLLKSRCTESVECAGHVRDAIIPLYVVTAMVATLTAAKKAKFENAELTFGGRWVLSVGGQSANYAGVGSDIQFPPYQKVIPSMDREPGFDKEGKPIPPVTHIVINASYMQDLTRVFPGRGKGGETPVRMAWGGALDPMRFDCETPSMALTQVYVVMPMRV